MIAILGATEDDILYFRAKIKIEREEMILGCKKVYIGRIFREEAVIAAAGSGNYLSAMVSAIILEKYDPYLVFSIGSCYSIKRELRQGDIFIADRTYLEHVDFSSVFPANYGQIPGFPGFYLSDPELSDKAEREAYLVTQRYIQRGYLLSGDSFYSEQAPLLKLLNDHYMLEDGIRAYDNSNAGIAIACHIRQVPLVAIRAVAHEIGNPEQKLNWIRKGLECSPTIGKIITRVLIDSI